MTPSFIAPPRGFARRVAIIVLLVAGLVLLVLGLWLPTLATSFVVARVKRESASRGLAVRWTDLRVDLPATARFRRLLLTRTEGGDTLLTADSLVVRVPLATVLRLRRGAPSLSLRGARIRMGGHVAEADSLEEELDEAKARNGRDDPARLARVRRSAQAFARLLMSSARELPALRMEDVTVLAGPGADHLWAGIHVRWLEHRPHPAGDKLVATGRVLGEREIPFEASFTREPNLRIHGLARFEIPDPNGGPRTPLRLGVDGALAIDRARHTVTLVDTSHVRIGDLAFRLGGRVEERGPRVALKLAADQLTQPAVERSLPPALLGPLRDLEVRGAWDYRVDFDLDLAHPDSVDFRADVIPHDLRLDREGTGLNVFGLYGPFVARIHLPRDRVVLRLMDPGNPNFRTLDQIAPELVSAVVTNEDGAFFRHRGFNTDAVKEAIAENVKSASFRRGAGTITMQLVRNLYLGHDRTLSRKGQEVVLAWVLEHLTGLSKERLLEIYLNIIEWGPGIHGANEAARFYFDRDARELSVDEALFLSILVPSPTRWRGRFDREGQLRRSARAQMHFIGRAMIAKGWLSPEALPPADQFRVEIRGPARAILFPDEQAEPPEKEREKPRRWLWGI
jgi:hypothetical protein